MLTEMSNATRSRAAGRVHACRVDHWRAMSTARCTRCRLAAVFGEMRPSNVVRHRRISTWAQTCAVGLVGVDMPLARGPQSGAPASAGFVGAHHGEASTIFVVPRVVNLVDCRWGHGQYGVWSCPARFVLWCSWHVAKM